MQYIRVEYNSEYFMMGLFSIAFMSAYAVYRSRFRLIH